MTKRARRKGKYRIQPKVGTHSRRLTLGALDLRTTEGKFAAGIRDSLMDQLGRVPTAAEQLLIAGAAIKALRCELLVRGILEKKSLAAGQDFHFLAWSNSLRRDLESLGIKPNEVRPPDLGQYLLERRKKIEAA